MARKTIKRTATTPHGTFSRTTAADYTHIVVWPLKGSDKYDATWHSSEELARKAACAAPVYNRSVALGVYPVDALPQVPGKPTLYAEICLYGNGAPAGAGWLAQRPGGLILGDGEPKPNLSFTEAVWQAAEALKKDGWTGKAWVYAATGEQRAEVKVDSHIPNFGSLKWETAPKMTVYVPTL